jgi:hypothetical protein
MKKIWHRDEVLSGDYYSLSHPRNHSMEYFKVAIIEHRKQIGHNRESSEVWD